MKCPVPLNAWSDGAQFRGDHRAEITALMYRFMFAMDFGDRDVFAQCVTDPVLWDLSSNAFPLSGGPADKAPVELGRKEFVALALPEAHHDDTTYVQHDISNPFIVFTGERTADILANVQMRQFRYGADSSGVQTAQRLELSGYYSNTVELDEGRWRIRALRLTMRGFDPAELAAAAEARLRQEAL